MINKLEQPLTHQSWFEQNRLTNSAPVAPAMPLAQKTIPVQKSLVKSTDKPIFKGNFKEKDFEEVGISPGYWQAPHHTIKRYNTLFSDHPRELAKLFEDIPGTEKISLYGGGYRHDKRNVKNSLMVQAQDKHRQGADLNSMTFFSGPNGTEVNHDNLTLPVNLQASGIAKKHLAKSMDFFERNNVNTVHLIAGREVGGYAWAKYGFTPIKESWKRLRSDIVSGKDYSKLPDDQRHRVDQVLMNEDPKAIWDLADMKETGKKLLLGSEWRGKLDLKDRDSMERFNAYVRK